MRLTWLKCMAACLLGGLGKRACPLAAFGKCFVPCPCPKRSTHPAVLQSHRRSDHFLWTDSTHKNIADMSDLCYNCHKSMSYARRFSSARLTFAVHPPHTCERPLQECLSCGVFGHTWNFCHLGPRRLQQDYQVLYQPVEHILKH